ncbi:kelch repeat-containing protein [Aquimarina sp. Aq78]|uniref:kelch repeat-containing protein n=1 Tax=Aquimarina sp. Aq78 TaxID=1191889 RepID=UPI000D10D17F|nr:kelch repeat-containing protein [Aquimarina sp. Aq78]
MKTFFKHFNIALVLCTLLLSCKNDDDQPIIQFELGEITLSTPTTDETLFRIDGELSWDAFVSNESFNYDIYIGFDDNNMSKIAAVSTTSYTIETPLEIGAIYKWKVTANNGVRDIATSAIRAFTTEHIAPRLLTDNAAFPKRAYSTTVAFNDKLWVIGGQNEAGDPLGDVWSSSDGVTWVLAQDAPPFGPIHQHYAIVFNNKLWVYGGVRGASVSRAIYSSEDGITWIEEAEITPFNQYNNMTMIVFNNKLWRIAGYNGNVADLSNERHVYSSTDGLNWILETNNHGFAFKYGMGIANLNNTLYGVLEEGNPSNRRVTIRTSTDGATWGELSNNTTINFSYNPTLTVLNNRLNIISGSNLTNYYQSRNGIDWRLATNRIPITTGLKYAFASLHGKLYAVAGGSSPGLANNSVWILN